MAIISRTENQETSTTSTMNFPFKLLHRIRSPTKSKSKSKFLPLSEFLHLTKTKKLVYLGEYHSEKRITPLIENVTKAIHQKIMKENGKLHVVWEHFSIEMQGLLKKYQMEKVLDYDGLVKEYKEIGTEAHDLEPYKDILEYCREHSDFIELHGGFLPRPYASQFMKVQTDDDRIQLFRHLVEEKGYLPDLTTLHRIDEFLNPNNERCREENPIIKLHGSKAHFNIFESLMTGRDIYEVEDDEKKKEGPDYERYEKIFQAQLMKDWAMAWQLKKIVDASHDKDRFLVLAGKAHLQHYLGVPEVFSWLRKVDDNTSYSLEDDFADELLVCAQMMYEVDLDEKDQKMKDEVCEKIILENELVQESMLLSDKTVKNFDYPVADVLYIYDEVEWDEDEENDEDGDEEDSVKRETAEAYNKVGETADLKGNLKKAHAILTYLGYTQEEQNIIGEHDLYNYQGVGNPFLLAKIKKGEKVLDLGSGLGIDSFLAAHYVGKEGKVVGVDLAKKEVKHTSRRAKERGLEERVSFLQGDIENLVEGCLKDYLSENESGYFDVVISNGAFCLTPDKQKAFNNVHQVLRPGGRMVICTTTVRKNLDVETQWPICMRMFVQLDKLKPMCEEVGFKNVVIDMEDSKLEFELEGVMEKDMDEAKDTSGRSKVHVGSEEFKHLKGYNMNDLCARVVVYGEKCTSH